MKKTKFGNIKILTSIKILFLTLISNGPILDDSFFLNEFKKCFIFLARHVYVKMSKHVTCDQGWSQKVDFGQFTFEFP